MITAYGNFGLDLQPLACTEVYFEGGFSGGSATFTQCGASRSTTIQVGAFEISFTYCIENGTIQLFGDVTAALVGPCEDIIFNP